MPERLRPAAGRSALHRPVGHAARLVTIIEATVYLMISLWLTLDATVGTGGALLILGVTITGMGAVIAVIVHRSR